MPSIVIRCGAHFGFLLLCACTLSPYYLPLSFFFPPPPPLFSVCLFSLLSPVAPATSSSPSRSSTSLSDFLLIPSVHLSICLSVPPMCCLCVYTCDERHWIMCTTGENGWSCNKSSGDMDVRIAYGVLGDLARSSRERAQPPWFTESYFSFRSGLLQGIWREYRVYEGECS